MLKVLKNLKESWLSVIAIVLLLIVQAAGDLTLPDYTSKIVNIGIQSGGIENPAPEVIRKSEMDNLLIFTEDDEQILNDYKEISKENLDEKEYEKLVKKYIVNKKKIEDEIIKINSINDIIREQEDIIQNIKTDEDKKFEVYKNAKNKLIDCIAGLIKLQDKIKEYTPNIDKKELDISENVIGEYRFISKTNIVEISNEYIIEKIMILNYLEMI